MSEETLGGLIDTLVAARHAGGFRYLGPERVLRQFAEHSRREGYADGSIVKEAVQEFLYGRHVKASTIRREELVLRGLAEHARQFRWQAWAPPTLTTAKKPHRSPPYVFSDAEIRWLFHAIDTQALSENSHRALTDPVLFRVFYGTGIRLGEALNLELRDFDPARAILDIRDGKNHESCVLPVTGRLAATLEGYIAAAHPCPEPGHKLFHTGDPSRPADKSTVYNGFRRYLAAFPASGSSKPCWLVGSQKCRAGTGRPEAAATLGVRETEPHIVVARQLAYDRVLRDRGANASQPLLPFTGDRP